MHFLDLLPISVRHERRFLEGTKVFGEELLDRLEKDDVEIQLGEVVSRKIAMMACLATRTGYQTFVNCKALIRYLQVGTSKLSQIYVYLRSKHLRGDIVFDPASFLDGRDLSRFVTSPQIFSESEYHLQEAYSVLLLQVRDRELAMRDGFTSFREGFRRYSTIMELSREEHEDTAELSDLLSYSRDEFCQLIDDDFLVRLGDTIAKQAADEGYEQVHRWATELINNFTPERREEFEGLLERVRMRLETAVIVVGDTFHGTDRMQIPLRIGQKVDSASVETYLVNSLVARTAPSHSELKSSVDSIRSLLLSRQHPEISGTSLGMHPLLRDGDNSIQQIQGIGASGIAHLTRNWDKVFSILGVSRDSAFDLSEDKPDLLHAVTPLLLTHLANYLSNGETPSIVEVREALASLIDTMQNKYDQDVVSEYRRTGELIDLEHLGLTLSTYKVAYRSWKRYRNQEIDQLPMRMRTLKVKTSADAEPRYLLIESDSLFRPRKVGERYVFGFREVVFSGDGNHVLREFSGAGAELFSLHLDRDTLVNFVNTLSEKCTEIIDHHHANYPESLVLFRRQYSKFSEVLAAEPDIELLKLWEYVPRVAIYRLQDRIFSALFRTPGAGVVSNWRGHSLGTYRHWQPITTKLHAVRLDKSPPRLPVSQVSDEILNLKVLSFEGATTYDEVDVIYSHFPRFTKRSGREEVKDPLMFAVGDEVVEYSEVPGLSPTGRILLTNNRLRSIAQLRETIAGGENLDQMEIIFPKITRQTNEHMLMGGVNLVTFANTQHIVEIGHRRSGDERYWLFVRPGRTLQMFTSARFAHSAKREITDRTRREYNSVSENREIGWKEGEHVVSRTNITLRKLFRDIATRLSDQTQDELELHFQTVDWSELDLPETMWADVISQEHRYAELLYQYFHLAVTKGEEPTIRISYEPRFRHLLHLDFEVDRYEGHALITQVRFMPFGRINSRKKYVETYFNSFGYAYIQVDNYIRLAEMTLRKISLNYIAWMLSTVEVSGKSVLRKIHEVLPPDEIWYLAISKRAHALTFHPTTDRPAIYYGFLVRGLDRLGVQILYDTGTANILCKSDIRNLVLSNMDEPIYYQRESSGDIVVVRPAEEIMNHVDNTASPPPEMTRRLTQHAVRTGERMRRARKTFYHYYTFPEDTSWKEGFPAGASRIWFIVKNCRELV